MTIDVPDYAGLERKLDSLIKEQKETQKLLSYVLKVSNKAIKQTWSIKDISGAMGVSESYIRTTGKYLLPRFGQSAFETGYIRWPAEEAMEWVQKPESEKKEAYQRYLSEMARKEKAKRTKEAPAK